MIEKVVYPEVSPLFDNGQACELYRDLIKRMLRKIVSKEVLHALGTETRNDSTVWADFSSQLPLLKWSEFSAVPFTLSFYLLCHSRPNAFKFFFEMVSRWLVPGKRLDVVLFTAFDFQFTAFSDQIFTVAEVMVSLIDAHDVATLQSQLQAIATEIRLGVASVYHAARILEIRGMTADDKTALIQENVAKILRKRASQFDQELFTEMQYFLMNCSDKFKAQHEHRYLSHLICFQYLFRRSIRKALREAPMKRHLNLKLLKACLHLPTGNKTRLGILLGMNLLGDFESFEDKQLLKAVQNVSTSLQIAEEPLSINLSQKEPIKMLYVEIVKIDGSEISSHEIKQLRSALPREIKGCVEKRFYPIFMPRNEEEIMRHIVTLSKQLKYVRDIPQVIISFDEQTNTQISFTVIMLRVLRSTSRPIQELFRHQKTFLRYFHDRVKIVGFLRKKYAKEATVFHVRLDQAQFLRDDHSVDLYKARQVVVSELIRVLGDVRDYNGGMISKQNEHFASVQELLGGVAKFNQQLLENFFHSLSPMVMCSLLDPLLLKTFFLALLDTLEDGISNHQSYAIKVHQEQDALMVMILCHYPSFKDFAFSALESLHLSPLKVAHVEINRNDVHCLGLLFRSEEKEKRLRFSATLEYALKGWEKQTVHGI